MFTRNDGVWKSAKWVATVWYLCRYLTFTCSISQRQSDHRQPKYRNGFSDKQTREAGKNSPRSCRLPRCCYILIAVYINIYKRNYTSANDQNIQKIWWSPPLSFSRYASWYVSHVMVHHHAQHVVTLQLDTYSSTICPYLIHKTHIFSSFDIIVNVILNRSNRYTFDDVE